MIHYSFTSLKLGKFEAFPEKMLNKEFDQRSYFWSFKIDLGINKCFSGTNGFCRLLTWAGPVILGHNDLMLTF